MKIATVMSSVSRRNGGLYDSARFHSRALAERPGIEISAWGIEDECTQLDIGGWAPVPVHVFPIVGPRKFAYAPKMRGALWSANADLLHSQGLWEYPSMLVASWHRSFRRPYLISPHGMLDPWAVRNSGWIKRAARLLYEDNHLRNARVIRALCEPEAQAIRAFGLRNPICIIPNGIHLPKAAEAELAGESMLRPLANGRKILLYLGRIHPKKGLAKLLQGWQLAVERHPGMESWMLVIAGWDQDGHEAELRRLSTEFGINRSVSFIGPQYHEAKAACYRDCDAFVLPSVSEGLPMVVIEAWSHAKPVLMTPQCNLPQGFAREAALKIEARPKSIAEGLLALVETSSKDRAQMGNNGYALAQAEFSWSKIADDTIEVCRWILGSGPRPACVLND
jgi:poly(glycerol-phosphate) alpha-glucosyltransferase